MNGGWVAPLSIEKTIVNHSVKAEADESGNGARRIEWTIGDDEQNTSRHYDSIKRKRNDLEKQDEKASQ